MIDNTEDIAVLTFSFLGLLEVAANLSPATIEARNYQVAAGVSKSQIATKVLPRYKLKQVLPLWQNLC